MKLGREDNKNAIETLKTNGIEITPPPLADQLKIYEGKGKKARKLMVDKKMYSMKLVQEVEQVLEEYRKGKKK